MTRQTPTNPTPTHQPQPPQSWDLTNLTHLHLQPTWIQVIYSNPVAMRATPKATGRLVGQLHPGSPGGMSD